MIIRALTIALALVLAQTPQTPESATIRGQVLDKQSGKGISGAVVVLTRLRANEATRHIANAEGKFEFSGLAADTYDVAAWPGEFRASHVAQGRGRSKSIVLKPGMVHEMEIPLVRALTISGRVVDEVGAPLSGATMQLRNIATGEQIRGSYLGDTDDLGEFRVFGLAPGRYVICAEGRGQAQVNPPAIRRAAQFIPTCYPSATQESAAEAIVLEAGGIEGVELRMQQRPTYVVSGVVVDSNGAPASGFSVTLSRREANGTSGFSRPSRGGSASFVISDLVPGTYAVGAQMGEQGPVGVERVEITATDIEGLVITLKQPVEVRGTVKFEDAPPAAGWQRDRISISARPSERLGSVRYMAPSGVAEDMTFSLKGLVGPSLISVSGIPAGAAVREVRYRTRDIRGRPTEFDGDSRYPLEIVLTTRLAELSGRVVDQRGSPVAAASILYFSTDPEVWDDGPLVSGRSRPDGTFRRPGILPGDYFVVAVPEADYQLVSRPFDERQLYLKRLSRVADRVTLLDNDRRALDLTLQRLPEDDK